MSEFLEKVAQESQDFVNVIMKVAEDDVVKVLTPQEQLDNYVAACEANGANLEDPKVLESIKTAEAAGDVYKWNIQNVSEIIAADIVKSASGDQGFETAAAAKAVDSFFDLNGAANLGSSFGTAPNEVGTVINASTDKNVFGGFGKIIRTGITNTAQSVNATSKVKSLLSGSNLNNIKTASDEEVLERLYTIIKTAADEAGQTPEEFVYDLGIDALTEQAIAEKAKETPAATSEGKIASMLKKKKEGEEEDGKGKKNIFMKKKEQKEESKEASDVVYAYIEKYASENKVDPEDLVLNFGLQKAAEYVDEVLTPAENKPEITSPEKIAASGEKKKSYPISRALTSNKTWAALGGVAGAGTGTLMGGLPGGIAGGLLGANLGAGVANTSRAIHGRALLGRAAKGSNVPGYAKTETKILSSLKGKKSEKKADEGYTANLVAKANEKLYAQTK